MGKGKVKVLLFQSVSSKPNPNPPMGLAYLGAVLEEKGCEVRIIDATAPYARYTITDLVREAEEFAPHLIGVTITINFLKYSYLLLNALTKAKLEYLIVAGGPHPSLLPYEVLEHSADIVVRDEGEETIVELVDYIEGKRKLENIYGIVYRNPDGEIISNSLRPPIADIDALPLPAKHLFREWDYVQHPEERDRFGHLFTSRGCSARCTYCSKVIFGNRIRFRSAQNVLNEILFLIDRYHIEQFRFIDDTFTVRKNRIEELCDLILNHYLNIHWVCITRLDFVNRELLQKMKEAGCRSISYGIESGNPFTLRRIKKGFTKEKAKEVVQMTREVGINCSLNFMFGFPWETVEDIRVTTDFIKEIMPVVTVVQPTGILIPFPGTDIYEEYKDQYHLQDWWLQDLGKDVRVTNRKIRPPLFSEIFFDSTTFKRNFFRYTPEIIQEITKTGNMIGEHNMWLASKRVALEISLPRALIYRLLILICMMSEKLYKISPWLERILMKPFFYAAEKYQHLN